MGLQGGQAVLAGEFFLGVDDDRLNGADLKPLFLDGLQVLAFTNVNAAGNHVVPLVFQPGDFHRRIESP